MRLMIKLASHDPWDLGKAYYSGTSFSVAAKETGSQGVTFKTDGLKMYIIGDGSGSINEYNLSTAWDISTASFLQSFGVSVQDNVPLDICFKTDGTKVFVVGNQNDSVYEYALSTAWNISTASFTQSFDVSAQGDGHIGLAFKSDGTKMFTVEVSSPNSKIFEYALSSAWDISTASFTQSFTVSSQEENPTSMAFNTSGKKVFVLGSATQKIYEYLLSTAWDISTAVLGKSFSVTQENTGCNGLAFKTDGTRFYMIGNRNDKVHQYIV